MSTRIVHRPARSSPSAPEVEQREVERPPQLPEDDGAGNLLMLVPMLGAGASMTVMMLFRGSGLAAVGALMMILTVVAFVVLIFSQRGKAARRRRMLRDRYLTYLDRQGAELSEGEGSRGAVSRGADPHPDALLGLVRSPRRLWERRRDDQDFLRLRIGTGDAPARSFVRVGDDSPLSADDEFMTAELERVEQRYDSTPDAPISVALDSVGHVSVVGDLDFCRRVARTLTCQAAALSSPEDLGMALLAPPERRRGWDWMTWLPHLADQNRVTDQGPLRRIAPDGSRLAEVLRPELHRRLSTAAEMRRNLRGADVAGVLSRLWVVLDTHDARPAELPLGDREIGPGALALTVVHLLSDRQHEPDDITVRITEDGARPGVVRIERYARRDQAPTERTAVLDEFSASSAEALCRYLAGLRLSPDSLEHDSSRQALRAADLLDVADLEDIDLGRAWAPRPRSSFLRVQIGTDDQGDPVMLDLKESAQFGMGPHGLAIGATGSGKSELLRTLVLGLCTGHGPSDVNLVLIDYKGGAAFAPFESLPHVAGVITNLGDDANLVERVYASLAGEVQRRQQLLKDAGNLADITAYRQARARGQVTTEPLPHLVIVIDEFGELLTARPDFIDLFLSIGRIGRSIGVHLLLSSQRIEGGKLRGLETYLSYRLGLRTLSEAESRTVLETPDAFSLPPVPGYGYLKVDTTTYTRFRAGYVSGALPTEDEGLLEDVAPEVHPVPDYADLSEPEEPVVVQREAADEGDMEVEDEGPTILGTVVDQLARQPRETRPIWLPPMPDVLTLDQAAGQPMPTRRGLRLGRDRPLAIPVGLLDDPARQWQGLHHLDLASAGGHVLVIGAPRSGKTTALLTVASSLALTHGVRECIVYGLDLLGSGLAAISRLPNVSGVATRLDREIVRRTVEEVHVAMHARESLLQQHRLPDLATARERARHEEVPWAAEDMADVVLLVDGIGQLTEEFGDLENQVRDLIRRGAGFGVHVVATASRANEVRVNLQTYFGQRLELRMTDPGESVVGRKLSETLSADRPGQFLTSGGLFGQLALPRLDGEASRTTAAAGLVALVDAVAEGSREQASKVRLLPAVVRGEDLEPASEGMIPLGLYERDLRTAVLDLDGVDRNLVVLGDNGTGRTGLLRHLTRQLIARHSPDDLVFAVFDPRRTFQGVVPEEYLGGYAPSSGLAERLVAAILPELQKRVPDSVDGQPDSAPPLPRIVLLADDYDVLTASGISPLAPLQPFVAMSHEINVSSFIARRTAGASRGLHEPVLTTVRETGATGLMFSGDRAEGPLLGNQRAQSLPVGRAFLLRTGQPAVTVQVVDGDASSDDEELSGVGFGGSS